MKKTTIVLGWVCALIVLLYIGTYTTIWVPLMFIGVSIVVIMYSLLVSQKSFDTWVEVLVEELSFYIQEPKKVIYKDFFTSVSSRVIKKFSKKQRIDYEAAFLEILQTKKPTEPSQIKILFFAFTKEHNLPLSMPHFYPEDGTHLLILVTRGFNTKGTPTRYKLLKQPLSWEKD